MGQQQLLLIVLGVIIVGVAVVLGIQYFSVGAEEAAKDELVAHSLTIGANAQQWYKKPLAMGGGGGTFLPVAGPPESIGWVAYFNTRLTKLHSTTNSAPGDLGYTCTATADQVIITATPKPNQGFQFTSVRTTVTPGTMSTEIL